MSRTQRLPPRHLIEAEQSRHRTRRWWLGRTAAVLGVLLLLLIPVVFVLAVTRTIPGADTRAASVSQPGPTSATAPPASAAPRPGLSERCRQILAAAKRMTSHADAAIGELRAHKKLMDDYKSGKIDRAAAIPQDSPWRQALARTLKEGAAAADQYDADKGSYRKLAAQCSKGG